MVVSQEFREALLWREYGLCWKLIVDCSVERKEMRYVVFVDNLQQRSQINNQRHGR